MRHRARLLSLALAVVVVAAACSDDDASDQVVGSPSASASASVDEEDDEDDDGTTSSTSSSSTSTSTTEPFDGGTTPTSISSDAASVALLTDVTVDASTVTFTFRGGVVPGVDAGYVSEVTAAGSGEPVAVEGSAHLQIRMEPASGVDLSGETFEETYTGPDRLRGTSPIAEVVRTGDFEANLTWVIGITDGERPYRVDVSGSTVVVSVAP